MGRCNECGRSAKVHPQPVRDLGFRVWHGYFCKRCLPERKPRFLRTLGREARRENWWIRQAEGPPRFEAFPRKDQPTEGGTHTDDPRQTVPALSLSDTVTRQEGYLDRTYGEDAPWRAYRQEREAPAPPPPRREPVALPEMPTLPDVPLRQKLQWIFEIQRKPG